MYYIVADRVEKMVSIFCMKVKVKVAQYFVSVSLWLHGLCSPWNSPGQNMGVGSLSLLQGIFPTQGSNPGLSHCRWILYQVSHTGSPRKLEWVAYPFSSGFSWPRNWTWDSCIVGGFFTNWATREAPTTSNPWLKLRGCRSQHQSLSTLLIKSLW